MVNGNFLWRAGRVNALKTARRGLRTAGLAVTLLWCTACQQRMALQPSFKPLDPSSFFSDGRSARPVVPGTIARGHLHTDIHLFTGKRRQDTPNWALPVALIGMATSPLPVPGAAGLTEARYENDVDTFPYPITREILEHGYHRYMIYCVVCHDPLGTGRGKIVERGYTQPPSYHIERLRNAPVGHFYDVITNGYGSMPDYRQQVPPRDRWAITAYIRALQLSQHFPAAQVNPAMRAEWDQQSQESPEGGQVP